MYTLRTIDFKAGYGIEHNEQLGKSYTLLNREKMGDEEFLRQVNSYNPNSYVKTFGDLTIKDLNKCKYQGCLLSDECFKLLEEDVNYYIMSESGKTFELIRFEKKIDEHWKPKTTNTLKVSTATGTEAHRAIHIGAATI
jgi:hypothetical protein